MKIEELVNTKEEQTLLHVNKNEIIITIQYQPQIQRKFNEGNSIHS